MNSNKLTLLLTREMPFGKYQGRKLANLPGHYLGWFARTGRPPRQLRRAAEARRQAAHAALRSVIPA